MTENKNRLPGVRLPTEYVERNGLMWPVEKGVLTVANESTDVAPVSPTGKPVLPQWLTITLTVLVAVAAVVPFVPGLPPVVGAIATVVVAIGAAVGIASPGVRTDPSKK